MFKNKTNKKRKTERKEFDDGEPQKERSRCPFLRAPQCVANRVAITAVRVKLISVYYRHDKPSVSRKGGFLTVQVLFLFKVRALVCFAHHIHREIERERESERRTERKKQRESIGEQKTLVRG